MNSDPEVDYGPKSEMPRRRMRGGLSKGDTVQSVSAKLVSEKPGGLKRQKEAELGGRERALYMNLSASTG